MIGGNAGGCNPFGDEISKEKVSFKNLFGKDFTLAATYHSHPPGSPDFSRRRKFFSVKVD